MNIVFNSNSGWIQKCNYCDGKTNESGNIEHEIDCEGKILIHQLRMLKPKQG